MTRSPFDDESVRRIRAALSQRQSPGSYEPGKWWVAPYSRNEEVLADAPRFVAVRDILLRNLDSMPGSYMPNKDRHRLLRAIAAAGVPEIVVSSPFHTRGPKEVAEDVEVIHETAPECKVVLTLVKSFADIEFAQAAGFDFVATNSDFLGEAACLWDTRVYERLWRGEDWNDIELATTADEMIALQVKLVEHAKSLDMPIGSWINNVAKQSDEYISEFCGTVGEAGADEIGFADGSSSMSPEAFAHVVRLSRAAAPSATVVVHPHDELGVGLTCGLAAVLAGAEGIEVSVNGYHLGHGQVELAATRGPLEALYGISTGIQLEKLSDLSHLAEELVHIGISPNQPVVGSELFALGWFDPAIEEAYVEPLLHKAITPSLVGGQRHILPTMIIGPFGIWRMLDDLGLEATKPEVEVVLEDCIAIMTAENRRITDDDICNSLERFRSTTT